MSIRRKGLGLAVGLASLLLVGCAADQPLAPSAEVALQGGPSGQACWGQASAVFAQMGVMGQHSSSFPTPREGLRNLARSLYDSGDISEDTMQALGAFVATYLELSIDACM